MLPQLFLGLLALVSGSCVKLGTNEEGRLVLADCHDVTTLGDMLQRLGQLESLGQAMQSTTAMLQSRVEQLEQQVVLPSTGGSSTSSTLSVTPTTVTTTTDSTTTTQPGLSATHKNCLSIYQASNGTAPSGVYEINGTTAGSPQSVYCLNDDPKVGGGWTLLLVQTPDNIFTAMDWDDHPVLMPSPNATLYSILGQVDRIRTVQNNSYSEYLWHEECRDSGAGNFFVAEQFSSILNPAFSGHFSVTNYSAPLDSRGPTGFYRINNGNCMVAGTISWNQCVAQLSTSYCMITGMFTSPRCGCGGQGNCGCGDRVWFKRFYVR
eukprot:m.44108 g.44108  ORF g.44108 m.44108 type:complete len:321 (-) comp14517_c0_seq1:53-1015(-)